MIFYFVFYCGESVCSISDPIRFVDKSNAGKMTLFLFFSGSFSCPSGLSLVL